MFTFIINLFTGQKSPSKTMVSEDQTVIVHKKCGNTLFYRDKDIKFGDQEVISETEVIMRGYVNCPHCKGQLVFDYNT